MRTEKKVEGAWATRGRKQGWKDAAPGQGALAPPEGLSLQAPRQNSQGLHSWRSLS